MPLQILVLRLLPCNVTALNAVTALSNPNGLLIHLQCVAVSVLGNVLLTTSSAPWYITCSRQRSTALWKQHAPQLDIRPVGGVANATTLDSAPVGQAPPPSSIPIPLPCPSNGMLPASNLTMSSLPTPCTIESPTLSPSQRCGHLLRRPQSSSIPTTPAAFSSTQINSVMTDFLGVKLHGGLPWLIFDVGSDQLSLDPTVSEPSTMGYVVLFEQASNTLYVTVDTVHAAAITAAIVPLLTMKVYFEGFPSTSSRYGIATPYSMCLIPS
eukprot:Em0014g907a